MLVYSCGDELKHNKSSIVAACQQLGCSDEITRLAVAVAMGETQTCCAKLRDASKDGTSAANYSCFNMNADMLGRVGWRHDGIDLNDNANVGEAVRYLKAAVEAFGVKGFLHFHRGGQTAFQDGTSYGAQEYATCIRAVMEELRLRPEHLTDDVRLGFNIEHV